MAVEKELSYNYANIKRDLSDVFSVIVKNKPVLSTLIPMDWAVATATKHEWLEDVVSPKSWVLDGAYTAADGDMTFENVTWLVVGSIVTFEKPTGASSTLTAKVTAVNTGTKVVTISVYGDDSVDENLADAAIVKLVSIPKAEGTDPTANDGREPTTEFNYTQIFDRTAKVSKTSQEIAKYGIESAIDYQVETQLLDLAYEMVSTIIFGKRVLRGASEAGSMWGILYFLNKATGNKVDASAGAISSTILNNGLAKANENGALNIDMVIWHPDQIRKVGAFNQNQIQLSQTDRSRGTYVTEYVGDLGTVTTLVSDRNFAKDKLLLVDSSKIRVLPLQNRGFQDVDAALPGSDYFARRILWEFTMEVKNANTHTVIYNLAI